MVLSLSFQLEFSLVWWHASVVSLPPDDVNFAQIAYPLNDVIFCLPIVQLTYLTTNIYFKNKISYLIYSQ